MKNDDKITSGTLGTFAGVFTPSVLTILGIILFLRLGYVVGSAGLGRALIIIALANTISVLTSFSLAAIATNLKVKGGGDYYLISRTLGLEFGGAIGIVLYLAQSISVAFYCIGFAEALSAMIPFSHRFLPQIIAFAAVSFLFIFAWQGADWATRFQYVVMAILGAALLSFFIGGVIHWNSENIIHNWSSSESGPGFWILFAIFFPAVTGFTQGVSMSGDLKDPGKSLPLGTFLAVGISILVYFGAAIIFSASLPNDVLAGDYKSMDRIAIWEFLINAGVIAATLSSAMASFMGAPRILQALAGDKIFPFLNPFAKGFGPSGNPRRCVLLSALIAFATIGLGKLNVIAPIVSMFFLISYGLLNYATFFEARSASPFFRPAFKWYNSKISLAGFIACLGVMLAIDLISGLFAISVLFAIYQYLRRTNRQTRWADSRRSYYLQRVRDNLIQAASEPEHPRDWRPQLLVIADNSSDIISPLKFASWIEGGSGLTTAVRILEGEGLKVLKSRDKAEAELIKTINENHLKAFPLAITAPTIKTGINILVQTFGIGPVKANCILFNWHDPTYSGIPGIGEFKYVSNLRVAFKLGCNLLIIDSEDPFWNSLDEIPGNERRIDMWWQDNATGRLMLLLAYLMTRDDLWDGSKIRVLAVGDQENEENKIEDLKKYLVEVRIEADPEIVIINDIEAIAKTSQKSHIIFLPFKLSGNKISSIINCSINDLIERLPVTILVSASEDIDLEAEPEEGKAHDMAEAVDHLTESEERVRNAREELDRLKKEVDKKEKDLTLAVTEGTNESRIEKEKEFAAVNKEMEKAKRREAKAAAKARDALHNADELGVDIENNNEPSEKPEEK